MRNDDLAPLFLPPEGAQLRKAFGKIISWNPETFENTIEWQRQQLHNLDVHAGTDALTWQPGQIVILEGYDAAGAGGWQTWWITGRLIRPGSGNVATLIEFMRGSLAREISAAVFADRVRSASVQPVCYRDSEVFGDPSEGDPGPTVPDVPISPTGTALVLISAQVYAHTGPTVTRYGGYMGVAVSGASTVSPGTSRSLLFGLGVTPEDVDIRGSGVMTRVVLLEGLNEGLHTFTAKYAKAAAVGYDRGAFDDRSLTVIGL